MAYCCIGLRCIALHCYADQPEEKPLSIVLPKIQQHYVQATYHFLLVRSLQTPPRGYTQGVQQVQTQEQNVTQAQILSDA